MCGAAGLSNGLGMVTYFWALTRIDASAGSMIFSLSPPVVLLLLALTGEKFTYRNTIRMALVVRTPSFWLGWPLALLAALAFSILSPLTEAAIGLGLDPTLLLAVRRLQRARRSWSLHNPER